MNETMGRPYQAQVAQLQAEYIAIKGCYEIAISQREKLRQREERLRKVLTELYALVRGECPRLLNEDSGGDAELDL